MQDEGLDLKTYWNIVLRWWWVFVLGTIGAALAGFLIRTDPIPLYEASTKVLVEGRQTPGTPSSGDIRTSQELASFYSDLILTRPVLVEISERLEGGYTPEAISGALRIMSQGSFIQIKAIDQSPDRAALIANTSAQTFIENLQDRQFAQIAQFQASLSQYGINQDPSIIAAQVASLQTLTIVESARPPVLPFNPPDRLRDTLLAGVVGLVLAGMIVFALEYFDDTIKSPEDLKSVTGLVTLGGVPRQRTEVAHARPTILHDDTQRTPLSETYKYVVLNLEFSTLEKEGLKTLVVTSALPAEGKTTTATNIAISMARSGKTVVLVDSDLRRPAMHKAMESSQTKGLTNVLLGSSTLDDVIVPTHVTGLSVIVSGPIPPDSTRVLRSKRMAEIVKELEQRADFIILDSPPVLAVADSIVLASLVNGTLFVVDSNKTKRDPLIKAVESIRQVNPTIVGAVLNNVGSKTKDGYYYHYSYYGSASPHNGRFKWLPKALRNGHKSSKRRPSHAPAKEEAPVATRVD